MIATDYEVGEDELVFISDEGETVSVDLAPFRECLSRVISKDSSDKGGFFDTFEYYEFSDMILHYIPNHSNDGFRIAIYNTKGDYIFIDEYPFYHILEQLLGVDDFETGLVDRHPSCFVELDGSDFIFINGINDSRLRVEKDCLFDSVISVLKSDGYTASCVDCDGEEFSIILDDKSGYICRMCGAEDGKVICFSSKEDSLSHLVMCMNCIDVFLRIFMDGYNRDVLTCEI
jgi:hypothetical protein